MIKLKKVQGELWNAAHYDANIGYVSRLGARVVELLAPQSYESILDLGCGTGDLTNLIAQRSRSCMGIDSSADMIVQAKTKYCDLTFVVDDGHTFRLTQQFDAVFSNAALHWMTKPELVIQSVRNGLRTGGRFVAEFGGKGNIEAIYLTICGVLKAYGIDAEARNPWYFPSIAEYSGLLENNGFEVRYMELYDRPTPLDNRVEGLTHWFKAFAHMFFNGLSLEQRQEAYHSCEKRLKSELFDGERWVADYRRLRLSAVAV
jgi:trans-aconitate methyltransferase